MANTFQFDPTTSEQASRGASPTGACACRLTVRIRDIHEAAVAALPNVWVFGEQRRPSSITARSKSSGVG